MLFGVYMLNVEHYKVGKLHQLIKLLYELRVFLLKSDARCIYTGMNVVIFGQGKQVNKKVDLHQGFASRYRYAAGLIERFIALVLGIYFLGCHLGPSDHGPGIRIMTVKAAHGAALDKHDKACTRTVNRTEGFK